MDRKEVLVILDFKPITMVVWGTHTIRKPALVPERMGAMASTGIGAINPCTAIFSVMGLIGVISFGGMVFLLIGVVVEDIMIVEIFGVIVFLC
ncbi:hypothetical protein DSO57_1013245 [Entomophthora muscae]|uniref:Uncharacterized protein n=1 Tax=Entomophthora muscae TaxID=34485 RepID=A0ACC2SIT9_9FUNG|nr:hypothetical protein DSO57_1013245 [Entomophthora muscae]